LIGDHNTLLGQAFIAISKFLKLHETGNEGWHAAIHGHSIGRTFPLTEVERRELQRLQIFTFSQLFEVQDNAKLFHTIIHITIKWILLIMCNLPPLPFPKHNTEFSKFSSFENKI